MKDDEAGLKMGGDWFSNPTSTCRRHGSKSKARKAASAMIAKIPYPLALHIARCYKPRPMDICGGESGPDWARSLRDECQAAGVPFFFKQWGSGVEIGSGLSGHPRKEAGYDLTQKKAVRCSTGASGASSQRRPPDGSTP